MAFEVKVPRLAESISEAVLVQWLKGDGEAVRLDEAIAVLETDKAAVELPAERPGVLHHARKVGDTVVVGDVVARIDEDATAASPGITTAAAPATASAPAPATVVASTAPATVPASSTAPAYGSSAGAPSETTAEPAWSPAVRRLLDEHGLDATAIAGSGRGGRLLKEDVERHLATQATPAAPPLAPSPLPARPVPAPAAAPRAAAAAPAPPPAGAAASVRPGGPAGGEWREGETERAVAMSRVRQRIAERLVEAQRTAAILTTFNEVDMSAVMALRARYKESFEQRHGVKLSFMSFFTRACVLALQQIPEINAEVRGAEILYRRHVHMGIAVGTPRGLVVPVVHEADRRNFAELEQEIARLAGRARDNRLSLAELSGGTFTISNGGVYGSLLSTPILNPPQSGILGMHKIEKRAVVIDDQLAIRPMMYLALSYDHRIVDGEQAVSFLVSVKERLEDPERMLLDM